MLNDFINWWDRNLDLGSFSPVQLAFFGLGFICWFWAYVVIIRNSFRYRLAEMPLIVAALDIGWEFDWGFLLRNGIGFVFQLGCMFWFLMDAVINYNALRYANKLITHPWILKNYVRAYLFVLIGGSLITYHMSDEAEDNSLGVISAYFINLIISSLYIYQLLNFPRFRNRGFSYQVAWAKFLGTGAITVASLLHWPDNGYLATMCGMVAVMDVVYIYLFKNYQPAKNE